MWWITLVSVVGLLAVLLLGAGRSGNWRLFVFQAVGVAAFVGLLYWLFPPRGYLIAKGTSQDLLFVAALYTCMAAGMIAQFLHRHFERPKRQRRKFDWGVFVAPVFASPIIFIPLLAAMQDAQVDLERITTARLMIFFVAFQNGFFWKEYFDHRRREIADGG